MKKTILGLSLILVFSLTACSSKAEDKDLATNIEEETNKPPIDNLEANDGIIEIETNNNTDTNIVSSAKGEVLDEEEIKLVEASSDDVFDETKFILDTFSEYGLNVSINDVIVKHEGNNKVAAIYKEIIPRSRPNISKLIFLRNGNSPKILHLQINNRVIK